MSGLTDKCYWILCLEDGYVWSQMQNNRLKKHERVDVNRPRFASEHGRVTYIILVSRLDREKVVVKKIPEGCMPVYACRTPRMVANPSMKEFILGYNRNGHRFHVILDFDLEEIGYQEDWDGCRY